MATLFLTDGDVHAQSRGNRPARVTPIPGIPADLPAEHLAAIRKHFEDAIADRNKRRAAAGREGSALLKRAEAEKSASLAVHAGLKFLEGRKFKEAQTAFTSAIETGAGTAWECEARIALFDIEIEQQVDPIAAENWLLPVLQWATARPAVSLVEHVLPLDGELEVVQNPALLAIERAGPVLPALVEGQEPTPRADSAIAADILLRAAVLAWMRGRGSEARATLHQVKAQRQALPAPFTKWGADLSFQPLALVETESFSPTYGEVPLLPVASEPSVIVTLPVASEDGRENEGAGVLEEEDDAEEREDAASRPSAAPLSADPATQELSLPAQLLRYADVLRGGGRPERAFEFLDKLITKQSRAMTKTERSYALLRRAHARFKLVSPLEKEPEKSLKDYDAAYESAPDAAWAGECLLLAGNLSMTLVRDDARAIAYYQRLVDDHAGSPFASRGAYYIGCNHEAAERWEEAYLAFLAAQAKFPQASQHDLIEDHLRRLRGRVSREFRERHEPEPTPADRRD